MADEKKTPAPEEPVSGKSPDAGKHDPNAPAQEETGTPERPEGSPVAETPKPPEEKVPEDKSQTGVSNKDEAEVVVPIEKISELIAKRNQAAREKAKQNTPPDKSPEGKQMGLFETVPTPKHGGRPPKAAKEPKDKPPQEKKPRDKVSQGKRGKNTPDKPAPGGGGVGGAPSVQSNAPTPDVAGSTAAPPRPVEDQKVIYLKLSELHPFHTFRPHPFQVKDDAKMKETVASVKQMGVITPATVRPEKDGSGYEIIARHRRCRASELAGLEVLPCIVREMTDHEAIREMRDSNKQRDGMLPTELARLLDLEMEDIKHQGVPLKNVAEGDIGKRSAEIVGEAHGMNYKKVMRYIRLNSLVPELQAKHDNYCEDTTNASGQITVPGATGTTNEDGDATVGWEDEDGDRWTLTVTVEDYETGRPIEDAEVSIGKGGNITVTLPDGTDMDEDNRITVTVTDNERAPQEGVTVIVKGDLGQSERGETDEDGKLTVPAVTETEYHGAYIYGYTDGTFGPERSMSRSEAAAIFARLLSDKLDERIPSGNHVKFTDVAPDAWYAGYVQYLTSYGITVGHGDGTYQGERPITRAEFTAMAVRFFDAYGDGDAEIMEQYAEFSDVSDGHWAAEYIMDAAIHGWVEGYGDGTFRADDEISRAEVVTIVNRLLGREADEDYIADNRRQLVTFPDVGRRHWAYYDVLEAANAHTAILTDPETWDK